MEIGPLIKLHRIKQNMKQEDLAKGIVSESYLSKIENQKTKAKPKTIQMLCNRLGIRSDDGEKRTYIVQRCKEWFGTLYEFNNEDQVVDTYEELKELINQHFTELNMLFEIHKIRYFIIVDDRSKALEQMLKLKELKSTFSDAESFYWYKYVGNYHFVVEDYQQALHYYKIAEDKLNYLELEESEVADIEYTIAQIYSKLRNTLEVIDYANKALTYYRKNYNLVRCAQGHILLGISYSRLRIFDQAIENYNLAEELAKISINDELCRRININLGYLYATKKEHKKAISYFEKVLNDKEAMVDDKLYAVISLSEQYAHLGKMSKQRENIEHGLHILERAYCSDGRYQFYSYKLHSHFYLLSGEYEKFETLVINNFIPYLEKLNDYGSIVCYATMLGEHFENVNKYKFATKYFKMANQYYEKLVQI